MLKAVIFDVDGTLAETEEVHREAFNTVFERVGLGWYWSPEEYCELLKVFGGKERIRHFVETESIDGISDEDILENSSHVICPFKKRFSQNRSKKSG